ncbi:MAG: hypothetical protein HC840_09320 [Leptolyngbyaceae cyanobacterium RM2_2_4]|nr:hypothetical protein [Leptolyngbyaceae cyanobacterium SM1_4_3]NJN91252.1 hypothetical protein [Leptolyngbyaceae cyanobacterium SL_5_14]NJO49605.1 hypothetical protein [Leptolyngbyaceae cyanobacterium RM2_2_4]NJO67254.1 hypothetical protein [Leptolyngbyaceae cyanobacterium RM1_405_57]
MNLSSPNPETGQLVSISRSDRWQVYARLQELDIPCICLGDGRFQAKIDTPLAALQLWSVIYQFTSSRRQLVEQLERCWQY